MGYIFSGKIIRSGKQEAVFQRATALVYVLVDPILIGMDQLHVGLVRLGLQVVGVAAGKAVDSQATEETVGLE